MSRSATMLPLGTIGLERELMTNIDIYRANAAAQRLAAANATLPNRRAMHERSAESWEAMAASAADTIARATVNEAAKASGASR